MANSFSMPPALEWLRATRVWKSIFRRGPALTNRSRSLAVFGNLFLHLLPVKVREKSLRVRVSYYLGEAAHRAQDPIYFAGREPGGRKRVTSILRFALRGAAADRDPISCRAFLACAEGRRVNGAGGRWRKRKLTSTRPASAPMPRKSRCASSSSPRRPRRR